MPTTADSQEAEIIRKVQSGQKDEYRHLVERYQNLILAMVRRQVGVSAVADDIAQEVFVKAYFAIKKFRAKSKFSTWLTRIALNQCSTYFSSRKFKEQQLSESFDTKQHDMSDVLLVQEREKDKVACTQLIKFQSALATLKPIYRDVLVLCALEEKSYQEVSEILDIPIGTVRSRLNKARLLVAQAIEEGAN